MILDLGSRLLGQAAKDLIRLRERRQQGHGDGAV
jgi:hypothetical protein